LQIPKAIHAGTGRLRNGAWNGSGMRLVLLLSTSPALEDEAAQVPTKRTTGLQLSPDLKWIN